MTLEARQRIRALAQGRGDGRGIAVPLAMDVAARIQERDAASLQTDPTQLANALRDLIEACGPDGVTVATSQTLTVAAPPSLTALATVTALEATRRLRTSMGDRIALIACLPGSAGADGLLDLAKAFLAAGVDGIVVEDHLGPPLTTLANVARFHQAVALATDTSVGLGLVERRPLQDPAGGSGLVLSDGEFPRDTDVTVITDWINAVRA